MRIGDHGGEGGEAAAGTIASIIGHKKIDTQIIVDRGYTIVVANHLPIAVEEEDRGGFFAVRIEAAVYCYPSVHKYEVVASTEGGRPVIPPGVEHDLERLGLVNQGVIGRFEHFSLWVVQSAIHSALLSFGEESHRVHVRSNLASMLLQREGAVNTPYRGRRGKPPVG